MRRPGHRSRRIEHLSTRERRLSCFARSSSASARRRTRTASARSPTTSSAGISGEEGEDCLSALPDDVLRLVLLRLDTRSTLATAALSRRWARLRLELPALEFKVGDVLPGRYRKHLRRRLRAADRPRARNKFLIDRIKKLDLVLGRYERHGMRSLAASLEAFLHADAERPGRRVRKVSLEIFPTHNTGSLDRLITTAVGAWGAEDLEVVVLKSHRRQSMSATSYSFPHRSFETLLPAGAGQVRLKKLKLSNCAPHVLAQDANPSPAPAPARAFGALAVLVLQDLPRRTRGHVYGSVIRACPVLEVLHLRSCGCRGRSFTIDAPDSRLTEMIVELNGLILGKVDLRALPRLERLACMGAPVELKLGAVPRLARLNLTYDEDASRWTPLFKLMGIRNLYLLSSFLSGGLTGLQDLVLRFTGPEMWVRPPHHDMPPLAKLTRLLVADMPPSWDIAWTCYILEAAPFLETLHIHVADDDDDVGSVAGELIWWPPSSEFRHQRLGEVVIGGFQGTPRQVHFVRFLTGSCTALREVVLLRHGVVRDNGLWDWEKVVPRQEWQWSEEDSGTVLRDIEDGMACSSAHIVFG